MWREGETLAGKRPDASSSINAVFRRDPASKQKSVQKKNKKTKSPQKNQKIKKSLMSDIFSSCQHLLRVFPSRTHIQNLGKEQRFSHLLKRQARKSRDVSFFNTLLPKNATVLFCSVTFALFLKEPRFQSNGWWWILWHGNRLCYGILR